MFGGPLPRPKQVKREKAFPMQYDILYPATGTSLGVYGHIARQPNTDYHVKLLHYKQRARESGTEFLANEKQRIREEKIKIKYDKHAETKNLQNAIKDRFNKKVEEMDRVFIHGRRDRLRELLCEEEKQFIAETIDQAQKGAESRMENMKAKAKRLKEEREAARLEIVRQKEHQHFVETCAELRPVQVQRNLEETKRVQLIQMQENQEKKEAERELDAMWHDLSMKEIFAKMEREKQDMLRQKNTNNEMMEVWDKQIEGKRRLKKEEEDIAREDRLEMLKLQEEIRREEIEALDAKRRKRDAREAELLQQVRMQEDFMAQRRKEEQALQDAFDYLARKEVEKELQAIQDSSAVARRETAIYQASLRELAIERKKEEEELNKLLDEHKKEIDRKDNEARCQLQMAKEALMKSTLEGREQQLKDKKLAAESMLKLQEVENEMLRMACDTNERLQAEHARMEREAEAKYRQELAEQIKQNHEKKQRELEEMEKELAAGRAEEERYRQMVETIKQSESGSNFYTHPFRRFLQTGGCKCPPAVLRDHGKFCH